MTTRRWTGPVPPGATETPVDPLPALQKVLKGRKLPTVAVVVPEEHIGRTAVAMADPAVETEIKRLLLTCGVKIKDLKQNELADWTRDVGQDAAEPWPRSLTGVDLVVTGEAFSEFTAQMGNLISCSARAEMNVISRKDGRIVQTDRVTTRAVDLAQNTAGRMALQKAGRVMAIRVLQYLVETAPQREGQHVEDDES